MHETNSLPAMSVNVKYRSDRLINYFLLSFFALGLVFALFYDTWLVAVGVGALCLAAYYLCKTLLPGSTLYQYILSAVLGIFMALYIYQMHGLFEMHFFAFIGSAILITYQNWKLQIPIMLVVVVHHATFGYLQNIGVNEVYFSQVDNFDLQTLIIHISLAGVIFFISGLWAYQLKKYNQDALIQLERIQNAEALEQAYARAEKALEAAQLANLTADKANRLLEAKNKELEQFAYVASHDLQEPLRTTSGFADLLQQQYAGRLDDKADKYLRFITESSDRMKVLIKDLLDYSRIGINKELEEVNCNDVVGDVLADLGKIIREQGANITVENLPVIQGYKTEMKQLFQNLVLNAIKFSKKNERPQIQVSAGRSPTAWTFIIRDNGIGIRDNHKERIFIIFQRLHTRTEYEGSGIGLAHCKKIVGLHGGKIWVDSAFGEGAAFHFTVPQSTTEE